VAPAAYTVAQSHYYETSFIRAIYAGDEVVGLLAVEREDDVWWLWRLMIDASRQRRGFGTAALAAVIDLVREKGAAELSTSYVPGDGGPGDFYLRYGFEDAARDKDGERVLRIQVA
jgi:diamine N-acetyltransferase